MNKWFAIFIAFGVLLLSSACREMPEPENGSPEGLELPGKTAEGTINPTDAADIESEEKEIPETQSTENREEQNNHADEILSLGGLHLGDSKEDVIALLGDDYQLIEDNSIVEKAPYFVMLYSSGTRLRFFKETNKVIDITTTDGRFLTNLGCKVGDTLETVRDTYAKFTVMQSIHEDRPLDGWYLFDTGEVLIFDFDAEDSALTNPVDIKQDAAVQAITISYISNFD